MQHDFSRRDFLASCSVLASAFVACSSVTKLTETGASFAIDAGRTDYHPTVDALIRIVLPIGSPGFPLDSRSVGRRLMRMFPLEDERRFLGLRRTLMYFDRLDLAPHIAPPLLTSERVALDVPARISDAEFRRAINAKADAEAAACERLLTQFGSTTRFSALDADNSAAWLRLWSTSAFTVKRDFARSFRVLILMSAYSDDRLWPAIGYDGPIVTGPERTS
jgi:hypothetical protein